MTFIEAYNAADADDRYYLDERAAIREYDGNVGREQAEAGAVEDWERQQKREAITRGIDSTLPLFNLSRASYPGQTDADILNALYRLSMMPQYGHRVEVSLSLAKLATVAEIIR